MEQRTYMNIMGMFIVLFSGGGMLMLLPNSHYLFFIVTAIGLIGFSIMFLFLDWREMDEQLGEWKDQNKQTRCTKCAGIIEDEWAV